MLGLELARAPRRRLATDQSQPVNVLGLSSGVAAIAAGDTFTRALLTSGGVKCWGADAFGQIGDGTVDYSRPTPTDVLGLSGVIAITADGEHACAITSGGAVKCWGSNQWGKLGDGTTTDRSSPVNVVGMSSQAIAVSAGQLHTCALLGTDVVSARGYGGDGRSWANGESSRKLNARCRGGDSSARPVCTPEPDRDAGERTGPGGWTAPSSTGGSPIDHYTVTTIGPGARTGGHPAGTRPRRSPVSTNGRVRHVPDRCDEPGGRHEPCGVEDGNPADGADAPTGVAATPGNARATVTWTGYPPSFNGGSAITGYSVTAIPVGGGTTKTVAPGAAATSATITGLVNGTTYTITVVVKNAAGAAWRVRPSACSPQSRPDGTDRPDHGRRRERAGPRDMERTDVNGGSPILSYLVTSNPVGFSATVPAGGTLAADVLGLANGTRTASGCRPRTRPAPVGRRPTRTP